MLSSRNFGAPELLSAAARQRPAAPTPLSPSSSERTSCGSLRASAAAPSSPRRRFQPDTAAMERSASLDFRGRERSASHWADHAGLSLRVLKPVHSSGRRRAARSGTLEPSFGAASIAASICVAEEEL